MLREIRRRQAAERREKTAEETGARNARGASVSAWGSRAVRGAIPCCRSNGHEMQGLILLEARRFDRQQISGSAGSVSTLLRTVAVHHFHLISGTAKFLAHVLGDHDGAVLSAGTAEGDRQIALAFINVMRQ